MYNLYIDESCHLEHDRMPVMCIGYTKIQYFYWVQSLSFIVLLRELTPDLLLITAYCVDSLNIGQLRKRLNKYRSKK
jgi:hypothetical protein